MSDTNSKSPKYWRSLGELCDTPEFRAQLEAEFPTEDSTAGFSRRRMLQLMGASMVLATAASCRWEEREILPFGKRPQNFTPGKFERYATAMELGGTVLGLMVTCVDGRPIKIEGNPKHPNSLGATNAYAQAAILELYDPDRSRHIIEKTTEGEKTRSWEEFSEFAKKHFEEYRKNEGEGLAVISEPSNSPTFISLRDRFFKKYPKAKWCIYDPLGRASLKPRNRYSDLEQAEIVLCIEEDIFGTHPDAVRNAHDFMKNRDLGNGKMKRLYVIESSYSITGAMADHRVSLPVQEILRFVDNSMPPGYVESGQTYDIEMNIRQKAEQNAGKNRTVQGNEGQSEDVGSFFSALAMDIASHPGKVAIFGGHRLEYGLNYPWSGETVALAYRFGLEAVELTDEQQLKEAISSRMDVGTLAQSIKDGKIRSLLVLGGNLIYNAPVDLQLDQLISKVSQKIHLGHYYNETAKVCDWHIPESHFLESWGDALTPEGSYSVKQPMIEPLHGGKSANEALLLSLGSDPAKTLDEIQSVCKKLTGESGFEKRWRELLHDGCVAVKPTRDIGEDSKDPKHELEFILIHADKEKTPSWQKTVESNPLEITFHPSAGVYDGRFANLSWLQEMPDPITRLTWDNVALFSPATAEKLGVKHEEIVRLKFKGREIEIPAYILPGQADGSVAVKLGYGRTAAGKVGGSEKDGVAPVGVNTYKLRTSDAMWFGTGLTVEPTGRMHQLASVAEHFAINKDSIGEEGRKERLPELVREATLLEYQKNPEFAKEKVHHPPLESLWNEHEYDGHHWGMTVDLSKCVGCGACVVACMAENNVPVVGKERIFKNREMHWMRIDRYFRGDIANPQIVFQPVMCQHCELAPCEGVCPVGATSHSSEGLNEMTYNRCVGTRYCANNCPYKVRRFNFFNYHKQYEDPANEVLKMASNPQVTVRMRGVMEKCTYCVQRIQAAKIEAKNEKRTIKDGEIKTACQQVCPAGAIIFGDLNDKNSEVSKLLADNRSYQMLGELNTKPRTTYLARIRNPNPELEKLEKKEEGNQHAKE